MASADTVTHEEKTNGNPVVYEHVVFKMNRVEQVKLDLRKATQE